jgi:hypothetical protein
MLGFSYELRRMTDAESSLRWIKNHPLDGLGIHEIGHKIELEEPLKA